MTRVVTVIDASVVVKWVLPEDGRSEALKWLDAYEAGQLTLIAPSLLLAEVGNVLSKRCRRKQITAAQARQAFRHIEMRAPVAVEIDESAPSAFELSLVHRIPIYDCLYVALAIGRGCELITADRRLYHATSAAYSFVKLLGHGKPVQVK